MTEARASRRFLAGLVLTIAGVALVRASLAGRGPVTRDFDVKFTDCVESIGVSLLPIDRVRALVPPEFVLAGEGGPVTPIVVRTARCGGIEVDGKRARPGVVVQIGAVIIPPDLTGDINMYTLWYDTTDARLAGALGRAGVTAQHVQRIDYDLDSCGSGPDRFRVSVPLPGKPVFRLDGHVVESSTPVGSFAANWWAKSSAGRVKMATFVPVIAVGAADLMLTTSALGPLGELIGGQVLEFPLLQQFNSFAGAGMSVTVGP